MDRPVGASYSNRRTNGTAEAARADEAVAHGRAHLDYQRRIASEAIHRHDAKMMRHKGEHRT